MKKYIIICLLLFFLFIYNRAYGEDFSIGREGEIIRPLEPSNVSLVEEKIDVNLGIKKSFFYCKTVLKNYGPAVEMFVGYPAEEVNKFESKLQTFHDFNTSIDGRYVPVMETNSQQDSEIPNNPHYDKWFLWPIMLDKDQTKEIINTFWTENTFDSSGNTETGFILKPAKYWYRNPQKISVCYHLQDIEPYAILSITPQNYRFEKNILVIDFFNEIPQENVKISFNPIYEFQILGLPVNEIKSFLNAINSKDYNSALNIIKNSEQNTSSNLKLPLLVQKGIVYYKKGELQKASQYFSEAINNKITISAPYYYLAEIYAKQKDYFQLSKLYSNAVSNHINPVILRIIESYNPKLKLESIPQILQINATDLSNFTAEIIDNNSDVKKITLQIISNENNNKKLISQKDIELQGQAYHYYVRENLQIPLIIENAYCKLIVYDINGKKVEKTVPITNRKRKIIDKSVPEKSYVLITILSLFILFIILFKNLFKDNRERKI